LAEQGKNTAGNARKIKTWMCWDLRQFRIDHSLSKKRISKWLGISTSYYEILESPQDYVPKPLPNYIADRLGAAHRVGTGQGRGLRMAQAHCPLHKCRLKRHRKPWLPQLRGKMKRWWAVCPVGGEIYTVRTDGLVRNAPTLKPSKPGRKRRVRGRPASKRRVFIEAQKLRNLKHRPTWREIARRLDPKEFAKDPKAAVERLRTGVLNVKKQGRYIRA
jgi:hypothetical protein